MKSLADELLDEWKTEPSLDLKEEIIYADVKHAAYT
jgi:hypothetical protein